MNNARLTVSCFLAIYLIFSGGCREKASEEVDPGTFNGPEYHNQFFSMTIPLPGDWSIYDTKTLQALKKKEEQLLKEDDKNFKAAIAASESRTVRLFAVFKYPLGTPVSFNPHLICLAERVRHLPGIARGNDYHQHTRKILSSSQLGVKFPEPVYSDSFGDVEFDIMYSETTLGNISVKQNQYATVIKGYVLLFITTFTTPEQEAELENILEDLTFD